MVIDKALLNKVFEKAKRSQLLQINFNFQGSSEAKARCLFNALKKGTILPIHRLEHIAESYMFLRGKIRVLFHNDQKVKTESFILDSLVGNYGVHIPKGQWHTLEVLESNSVLFEVKEGPYTPLTLRKLLK